MARRMYSSNLRVYASVTFGCNQCHRQSVAAKEHHSQSTKEPFLRRFGFLVRGNSNKEIMEDYAGKLDKSMLWEN